MSRQAGRQPGEGVVSRTIAVWREFWFQQIPPHSYALLRILVGATYLAILLQLHDVDTFWSLTGFVRAVEGAGLKGWLLTHGAAHVSGLAAYVACLIAVTMMVLGLWSRFTVPLTFAAALGEGWWNGLPMSGADSLLRGVLLCMVFADCGAVWSLDAWLARRGGAGAKEPETQLMAPLRLVRFQLAIMYLGAGLWKLPSSLWREGLAVHYVLNTNVYHRFPSFHPPEWLSVAATYSTLSWELAFAPALLFRPTRRLVLIAGVFIHLGMFFLMEVGPFHIVVLVSYLAFLPPQFLSDWSRRFTTVVRVPGALEAGPTKSDSPLVP